MPTIPDDIVWRLRPKGVFGVAEVRTHQFKVSPDDLIYVDKIKGVGVNDVVSLPRVLMLGNKRTAPCTGGRRCRAPRWWRWWRSKFGMGRRSSLRKSAERIIADRRGSARSSRDCEC